MNNHKTELLDRLMRVTRSGKVSWEKAAIPDVYKLSAPDTVVYIRHIDHQANALSPVEAIVVIEIRDRDGEVLYRIKENQLDSVELMEGIRWLYTAAKQSALQIAVKLGSLLDFLDEAEKK
jgi:hypothetical protein